MRVVRKLQAGSGGDLQDSPFHRTHQIAAPRGQASPLGEFHNSVIDDGKAAVCRSVCFALGQKRKSVSFIVHSSIRNKMGTLLSGGNRLATRSTGSAERFPSHCGSEPQQQ